MLKSGTQLVVVMMGLSTLALSTGCGRDKQAFDQKLSAVKADALQSCLEAKQSADGCESGMAIAEQIGRAVLPGKLVVRTEGEERVTEVRVQSLSTYMSSVSPACASDATPTRTDREGFAYHMPMDRAKKAACEVGAREFFIEFGKSCGLDIASMGEQATAICQLKRELIVAEVKAPAEPASAFTNRLCHAPARNCP